MFPFDQTDETPSFYQVSKDYYTFGLLDASWKELLPLKFRKIQILENGQIRGCDAEGNCQQFLPDGTEVTPPVLKKYFCTAHQNNGLTAASIDGTHYGLADDNGNWMVEPEYFGLEPCHGGQWFTSMGNGGRQVILPQYPDWKSPIFEDALCFTDGSFWGLNKGVWQVYGADGKPTGASKLDLSMQLGNRSSFDAMVITYQNKFGLLSSNGVELLAPEYAKISREVLPTNDYIYLVKAFDGKQGAFYQGQWLVSCKYEGLYISLDYGLLVATLGDSTKLIDLKGQIVENLPFRATEGGMGDKFFVDYRSKKQMWSPSTGVVPLPPDTRFATDEVSVLLTEAMNGTRGLIAENGQQVLSDCDEITVYRNFGPQSTIQLFRKNNLWGLTEHTRRFGFEPQYTRLEPIKLGNFVAEKDFFFGVVNYKNEQVLPFEFDDFQISQKFLFLKKEGKWAAFEPTGLKPISNFSFDQVETWADEFFLAVKDGLYFLFDPLGKQLNQEGYTENPSPMGKEWYTTRKAGKLALFASNGSNLTSHEFLSFERVYYPISDRFCIKGQLPSGEQVFFDKNGRESFRAFALERLKNGNYAFQRGVDIWEFRSKKDEPLSDLKLQHFFIIDFAGIWGAGQDQNGVWQLIDLAGKPINTVIADKLLFFKGKYNSRLSVTDANGRHLIYLPDFSKEEQFYDFVQADNTAVLNKKYGYVDMTGRSLIPCEYDYIQTGDTWPLLIFAKKNGLYDLYHRYTGKLLVSGVKEFQKVGKSFNSYVTYRTGDNYGMVMPETNKVVEPKYSKLEFWQKDSLAFYIFSLAGQRGVGLLDEDLNELLPPVYSAVHTMDKDFFSVMDFNSKRYVFDGKQRKLWADPYDSAVSYGDKLLVKANGVYSFLEQNGNVIFKVSGDNLYSPYFYDSKYFILNSKDGTYLLSGANGERLAGPFDKLTRNEDGKTFKASVAGKWGLFDLEKRLLTKPEFDELDEKAPIGFLVKKGEKWGILDPTGQVLLPTDCDLPPFVAPAYLIARQKGKFRFYGPTGKLLFKETYDYALAFSIGLAPVCQNGKWGYIDRRGKLAIPYQYDYAHPFEGSERLTWVMQGTVPFS